MTEKDIKIVSSVIDREKDILERLSLEIWQNPELGFQEFRAHKLLTDILENYGFQVQREYFLQTAFRAEYSNSNEGPVIAVLCEYDCLPEIGHACGHNLIAEAGIAAGIAVKSVLEKDATLKGKIVVLGSPAEEGGAGKVRLIERGTFDDIDAAIMVHPSVIDAIFAPYLCVTKGDITFFGKEAHASVNPWDGINALDAAVSAYVNLSMLRQQIRPMWRIHSIIKKGGEVPNVIPGETQMEIFIRTETKKEMKILREKVEWCFESAAKATGCTVECKFDDDSEYLNVIGNKVLGSLYQEYAEPMGVVFADNRPELSSEFASTAGSTDMGNVSYIVPSLHPLYKIGPKINHTRQFTDQARTEKAEEATKIAAKAMALSVVRLMRSPDLLQKAKEKFQEDLERNRD